MSFRKTALVVTILAWATAPALAQTTGQSSGLRQDAPVRIQTSFNFFVPGPSGDGDEAVQARDKARKAIYEMAARECDLLRDVLAKDCRLESINSNIGRQQFGPQQPDGYTVNGNVSLQITVK